MDFFELFQGAPDRAGNNNPKALRKLEDKIDLLLNELGIVVPDAGNDLPPDVRQLIERGDKIGAIKVYREATGVGLREAKEAVDTGTTDPIGRMDQKMERILETLGCSDAPHPVSRPDQSDIDRQIRDLLRQGNKIHAIKLYRDHYKTGIKETIEIVDQIDWRNEQGK